MLTYTKMARQKLSEQIAIPEGVHCEIKSHTLVCKKGAAELVMKLTFPNVVSKIENNHVIFSCESGNKKIYKTIKSLIAHTQNMISGVDKEYIYKLESCNVHFPMTFKIESGKFIVNNFLGEKKPRITDILPNVKVDVKAQKITITSHDKRAAGQTAANLEKVTRIRNRDRRIFQDGIYIVERPHGGVN